MCFLEKRHGKGQEGPQGSSVTLNAYLVALWKSIIFPVYNVRMLLVIPLIAYSGLQQAFVWYFLD